MARDSSVRRQRRRRQHQRISERESTTKLLETLAVVLLAEAKDSGDQLIAVSLALVALDRRRQDRRNGRCGRRGPYDQQKSEDFFDILLNVSSDRMFKVWLR
ncbi:uncharacterized protein EDB91DRAFT_1136529 [Suillus paluster]|uniref:uncharacterized protein n=1 Tax=Suillus paluster TaxID=48578 RepID=UPI001B878A7F|nr:uncharacterized protein EDB91DRAFT_1136529 [Suillus paluster]KAG1739205.1 hypothetical protein EDB91DRAFT_1136529 [Suillus paluster]